MTEELKKQLEEEELKLDQEAKAILDKAMQEISAMNRVVTPSATFIGSQVKWQLHIIRK